MYDEEVDSPEGWMAWTLRLLDDQHQRAQQAAELGDWREAAEQLLLPGVASSADAHLVIGGWQGEVTFWDGDQSVVGHVRSGPEAAIEDAYRETYRYLTPSFLRVLAGLRRIVI